MNFKSFFLVSLLLSWAICSFAQGGIYGRVKIQNSQNKPLSDVKITHIRANTAFSKTKGEFALIFNGKAAGDTVLGVAARKDGYKLLNEFLLQRLVLAKNENENPLILVFASEADYEKSLAFYLAGLDKHAHDWYIRQLKESNKNNEQLKQQYNELQSQNEAMAEKLAATDLDIASDRLKQAIAYTAKGDYDNVIKLLNRDERQLEIDKTTAMQNKVTENFTQLAQEAVISGNAFAQTYKFSEAITDYKQVIAIYGKYKRVEDMEVSDAYNFLSIEYLRDGKAREALTAQLQSIRIKKTLIDTGNIAFSINYSNLSAMYQTLGDYNNAVLFQLKAIDLEKLSRQSGKSLVTSYNNLSLVYLLKGSFKEAKDTQEHAIELAEADASEKEIDKAELYANIAVIYRNWTRFDDAEKSLLKAIEIYERFDPNNPVLGYAYDDLANIYQTRDDYIKKDIDQALNYRNKAKLILEKTLHPGHPDLGILYGNFSSLYQKKEDYDQALKYQLDGNAILEKAFDANNPVLAMAYNNTSLIYLEKKDYDKAFAYSKKAIAIQEKVLASKHPELAKSYNNIGLIYRAVKDYDNSILYRQKAIDIQLVSLPKDHPELGISYYNIGFIYHLKKDNVNALINLKNALRIFQKSFDPLNTYLASTYSELALVYWEDKDIQTAIAYEDSTIRIQEAKAKKGPSALALSYHRLATMYTDNQNFSLAIEPEKKAYLLLAQLPDVDKRTITTVLFQLTTLYVILNNPAKMKEAKPFSTT
jgi:tetratricopeptide (TPR) repeat protein